MKLKYKHQRFQEDAARAVTDCFSGQPHYDGTSNFLVDQGIENGQRSMIALEGYANAPLEPGVPLRDNIRRVQTSFGPKRSASTPTVIPCSTAHWTACL